MPENYVRLYVQYRPLCAVHTQISGFIYYYFIGRGDLALDEEHPQALDRHFEGIGSAFGAELGIRQ